jgi:hypothetical protein
MQFDDSVLYEEFVRARQEAVALTDQYREAPADAPYRDELWERVVRQTETARMLLEMWLRPEAVDPSPTRSAVLTATRPSLTR